MIIQNFCKRVGRGKRLFSSSVRCLKKDKVQPQLDPKVQEAYDLIAYMSVEDVAIQNNLDQGTQFSFPSEHYLDRKEILRRIPNSINLLLCESVDLDKIYHDLDKLDSDKSVQLKYLKKYLRNYDDPIVNLTQEFNGINKKFKLLRRNEMTNLMLSPSAFYHNENLFNHAYNVVGFDKSISGLPLWSEKNRSTETCYPKEFVEDLQMFRTTIPVHKRDLNFLEQEKDSVSIDPKFLQKRAVNEAGDPTIDKFLDVFYEKGVPEFTLPFNDIHQYRTLPAPTQDLIDRFESEILQLRNFLQSEIKFYSTKSGSKILLFANQEIRTNQFKLCQVSKSNPINSSSSSSLLVINYDMKGFNVFPNYALLLKSRRQLQRLSNHLIKLFLINLEDQIEILIRIKYYKSTDMNKFLKHLKSTIRSTVAKKIIAPFLDVIRDKHKQLVYDALIHETTPNSAFKRIYWNDFTTYAQISSRSRTGFDTKRKTSMRLGKMEDYMGVRDSS